MAMKGLQRWQNDQWYQRQPDLCRGTSPGLLHYPSNSAAECRCTTQARQMSRVWRAQAILLLWRHKVLKGSQPHIKHSSLTKKFHMIPSRKIKIKMSNENGELISYTDYFYNQIIPYVDIRITKAYGWLIRTPFFFLFFLFVVLKLWVKLAWWTSPIFDCEWS